MRNLNISLLLLTALFSTNLNAQNTDKQVTKHGMSVSWALESGALIIEMSAPTTGWVTVGFNDNSGTNKAYLLMGNVVNGKLSVEEHYTLNPGNYKSFKSLSTKANVSLISGEETDGTTTLKYSISFDPKHKYQKQLKAGDSLYLLMAYSRADDFQHHSMWRKSIQITL